MTLAPSKPPLNLLEEVNEAELYLADMSRLGLTDDMYTRKEMAAALLSIMSLSGFSTGHRRPGLSESNAMSIDKSIAISIDDFGLTYSLESPNLCLANIRPHPFLVRISCLWKQVQGAAN